MEKILLVITLVASAALLSACSTPVDLSQPPASRSTTSASMAGGALNGSPSMDMDANEYRCDADPAQSLLGKTVNDQIEAQAKRLSGAKVVRTLRPRNVITMEYNPQRINLRVDKQGMITSIGCG